MHSDLYPCNVKEWVDTSDGTNDIYVLLEISKNTTANQLLSLYHGRAYVPSTEQATNADRSLYVPST